MKTLNLFLLILVTLTAICFAGTLKDSRDNHVYKTVVIGYQEWMAENLNFKVNDKKQTWCYDNKEDNCKKYGRLYTWSAAMAKPEAKCGQGHLCDGISENHRGICPEGFYLPSKKDWEKLMKHLGSKPSQICTCEDDGYDECYEESCYISYENAGYRLKSRSCGGEDAVGFNAQCSGFGYDFKNFDYMGQSALFWSTSEIDEFDAYRTGLLEDENDATWMDNSKLNALPVRCVRNIGNVVEVRNEDELRATAEAKTPELRKIYNQFRSNDSSLKGKIGMKIFVNEAGDVYDVVVTYSNIDDNEFIEAIVDAVWAWKFGPAETGYASVVVPFAFF